MALSITASNDDAGAATTRVDLTRGWPFLPRLW